MSADVSALEAEMIRRWPAACARWSRFLLLSRPIHLGDVQIARIDLASRQVAVNLASLAEHGLGDTVEAVLAHEVGHHVRYPGSLAILARLMVLERTLLPIKGYSLINIFCDLLINHRLGPHYADEFSRIYAAFSPSGDAEWGRDPAFLFYMAVYEELWQRPPGSLMGAGWQDFAEKYPDYRAQAQLLGQDVFHMGPNLYIQYLYFLSVVTQFIEPVGQEHPESLDPYTCIYGEPDDEDWARALNPDAAEREALRRALERGWIREEDVDQLSDLERRVRALPGQGTADAARVPDIMAAWYRQQAERHLVRPPPLPSLGEAIVPTTHEPWEAGDPVRDIDWLSTLREQGAALGAAMPLKRHRIAEIEGYEVPLWRPRLELYLDVSGSMPDPRVRKNAMTLAAQILTLGASRAGGRVRALMYSHEHVRYWEWCRSAIEISRFLMHYVGGGTRFPFEVLQDSLAECGAHQPVRVIITDTDFDHNYDEKPQHAATFAEATARSQPLLLLQHRARPALLARYRRAGARVVPIAEMDDFPRMAAALARALFPSGGQEGGRVNP